MGGKSRPVSFRIGAMCGRIIGGEIIAVIENDIEQPASDKSSTLTALLSEVVDVMA